MLILTSRYHNAFYNLERLSYTFLGKVHTGVNFHTGIEFPVIIYVEVAGFLKTIETPVAAIIDMGSQFVETPEIIWADCAPDARSVFTEAAALQETYLRVKVLTYLGITQA